MFQNNSADSVGGAILVNNPSISQDVDPVYNSFCFLQYNLDDENSITLTPDKWVRKQYTLPVHNGMYVSTRQRPVYICNIYMYL